MDVLRRLQGVPGHRLRYEQRTRTNPFPPFPPNLLTHTREHVEAAPAFSEWSSAVRMPDRAGDCINCLDKSKFGGQGVCDLQPPCPLPPRARANACTTSVPWTHSRRMRQIPCSSTSRTTLCATAGVRKQSCIMRRCVRMTSNGVHGSGGGGSAAGGRMTRDLSNSSLSTYGDSSLSTHGDSSLSTCGDPYTSSTDSDGRTRSTDTEQALFWAAVSGCLALNGSEKEAAGQMAGSGERTGSCGSAYARDDESSTRGTMSVRDSSSASPRGSSPTHSNDSDDPRGGSYRRMYLDHDYASVYSGSLSRAPPTQSNGTGSDSFCCKLATVLASDKRLGAQPIALRALQKAGMLDHHMNASTPSALGSAGLASHLLDPQKAPILAAHLAAVAGPVAAPALSTSTGRPGSPHHNLLDLQQRDRRAASYDGSHGYGLGNGLGNGLGLNLPHTPRTSVGGGAGMLGYGGGSCGGSGGSASTLSGSVGGGVGSVDGYAGHAGPRVTSRDVGERRVQQLLSLVAQREFMAARGMTMPGHDDRLQLGLQLPLQHSVMPRVVESGHGKGHY